MAKIQKISPLLNLQNFQVFLNDTVPSSNYFRVSEMSDTFTAGKNGFLIEGSPYLKGDTEIKIEILDVDGNPLFVQAGEGIPEYYEGLSKLISAHVYQDTPIGIGKITILGELKTYVDENGFEQPVPDEWVGVYNVKWEKNIKINKNIPNETRVRFIKRPEVEIEELDESFYAKTLVATAQSSSTVRGYALTPAEGTDVRGYRGGIRYYIENEGGDFKDGATTISVTGTGIQDADVLEYLNQNTVIVRIPYTGSDGKIQSFTGKNYALNYQYFTNPTESPILGSFGRFSVSNLATFVGDVERLKVFRKSKASNLDYAVIQDTRVDSAEILTNVISGSIESIGFFTASYLDGTSWNTYWSTQSSANTSLDSSKIYKAVKFKNNRVSTNIGDDLRLYSGSEYTLEYYSLFDSSSANSNDTLKVYFTSTLRSGSGIANYYLTQSIETITGSNEFRTANKRSINFIPVKTDNWTLHFDGANNTTNSYWQVGSVSLKSSNELGYSPDSFNFIIPIDRQLEQETFDFKFEHFDINNNYIPVDVFATKQFVSGNIKLIDKEIIVDADKNYFSFDSDLIAIPESQQVNISISKNRVLGNLLITSQAFDSGGVPIPPASYSALPSPYNKYPGSFGSYSENLYSASAVLTLNSFTGSRHSNPAINNVILGGTPYGSVIVDRIVYTLTETSSSLPATKNFTIFRQSDGEKDKQVLARANKNQFTYKRTTLEPDPSNQRIVISVDRLNLPSSSGYPITQTKSGGNLLATLSGSANTSPITYTLDAGTNAATAFVTGSGYNSTTYIFQQLDRRGVPYTGSVTIDPVVINSPLTVNLSNDNFNIKAKSSLYASQFSSANNDVTESTQFTAQKAKVTVNVGGEAIAPAATSTTNRFWITTAVSGCLATTTTGSTATDGIDVGISAFTNNSYEQGLVTVTINYKDALGVTETATKTITFKKQRNSVPTIDLNVNPTSQTLVANSVGAVAGGNTTAGYTTLSVTATENGTDRFNRIKSVSQVPVSTITTAISTNTVTLNNMVSGSDSVQLTLDEVHYTFGEGSYGTGSLKSSVTKARKAAPVLRIEVSPKDQSVTAKSTGEQVGAFAKAFVTVKETYDGSTTTKTITSLTATSADIANIQTTASTGEITLAGRTLANGVDSTTVAVSATITDTEGTSRVVTDGLTLSKVKNSPPTTTTYLSSYSQTISSGSAGYGTPSTFVAYAKEAAAYSYSSTLAAASTYRVSVDGGTTWLASATITPNAVSSDAGSVTTITIGYKNSEGTAGTDTLTHKVLPTKDGRQGPGLLYIGDYDAKLVATPTFVLNNSATKKDAVSRVISGNKKYYAFRGADGTLLNAVSAPVAGGNTDWEEFTSFSAVATGLLIAEESFVQNTINVGYNTSANEARITIYGGNAYPYISVGQTTKTYGSTGIWLGNDNDNYRMSLVGGSGYLKWDGSSLTVNGIISASSGYFSGNITSVATISGGTISGGTVSGGTVSGASISGGTISIGSGNAIFKADGNGIYLGNSSFASAPFNVSPAGVLSAVSANISGSINASVGQIGGWTIQSGKLINSNNRLVIDPSIPGISIYDDALTKRLDYRYGGLSNPSSTTQTITPATVNAFYTVLYGGQTTTNTITADSTTFTVSAGGTYLNTTSYGTIVSSFLNCSADWYGYASADLSVDVIDTSTNAVVGTIYVGSANLVNNQYGSPSSQNVAIADAYSGGDYLNLQTGVTYKLRTVLDYYVTSAWYTGTFVIAAGSTSITPGSKSYTLQIDQTELTNDGLQVIASTSNYVRMQRGGYSTRNAVIYTEGNSDFNNSAASDSTSTTTQNASGAAIRLYNSQGAAGYALNVVSGQSRFANLAFTTGGTPNRVVYVTQEGLIVNANSDKTLKENIRPYTNGLAQILELNPVSFNWKDKRMYGDNLDLGLIAQDVEPILPELVGTSTFGQEDESKFKLNLNYEKLVIPLINAVKELSAKVDKLEAYISSSNI